MALFDEIVSRFKYDPTTGHVTYARTKKRCIAGNRAGWLENTGYRRVRIGGEKVSEHVLIWILVTGKQPSGQIDHINHVRDDNRWCNLRCVTKVENGRNQSLHKRNTSKVCGVYWSKTFKKWTPQIRVNGKLISLGYFRNKDDAISARKAAEIKYGFHPNHGAQDLLTNN